ncbi:hypothetical protein CBW65_05830 [Tumebacillus avium]|uniref:Helix-hairpin-helix DNA-binding motif class 1 domain-containing protein n=1 Tax=Tumebacillus avium TaxID=1903704 RepID=A0A1Y0IM71_9BACL|nr:helix-hairpin-helix domain-containing protein [Tumebacillus avium]ARU60655.1 hypothetical protein CBW65_05830 [Tumebacillus avium]
MASITPKGSAWEWGKSLWMVWLLLFGMTTWISFLYIAYRAKQNKWAAWGLVYFAAFVFFLAYIDPEHNGTLLGELSLPVILLTWVVGILHGWMVRKEYLLRIVALSELNGRSTEALKNQIELEYDVDIDAVGQPKKGVKPVESQNGKQNVVVDKPQAASETAAADTTDAMPESLAASAPQMVDGLKEFTDDELAEETRPSVKPVVAAAPPGPEGPVDINNDTMERLATLPKVGIVLAMKAVSIRETQGGFDSVEQFVEAVGLKPHVAELLRELIVIRPLE